MTRHLIIGGGPATINAIAAGHFNKGQRAFFFSLGYLGWFIGPLAFMAARTSHIGNLSLKTQRKVTWNSSLEKIET